MSTLLHILDDAGLGGVTRFLDALERRLMPDIRQARMIVNPLKDLLPALDADLVVIHFTMSWSKLPYLLALRARRGKRPIVLIEHSYTAAFERLHVRTPKRFRTMLRLAYALVDRVVAVSYGQAAWMRRARLLHAEKLTVIAPFTDCETLSVLPPPAAHSGPLRLGAYGRFCGQKDFPNLIAAMQLVDPLVATLTIRGFGPDADALHSCIRELPHVEVGDKLDNLHQFLASVDAIVVPSAYEPFGQVALEARLAARPLIVTDVDGLPEQVEPAAGLIVPPGDPAALAAAIVQLAAQRTAGNYRAMAWAARASAMDHVTTSTHRWHDLVAHLTASRRGTSPTRVFLSDVDTGSRQANAAIQNARACSPVN